MVTKLPVLILKCLTIDLPVHVCLLSFLLGYVFALIPFLLPTPIRTISVRQNTTGGCVPVRLQIKHN